MQRVTPCAGVPRWVVDVDVVVFGTSISGCCSLSVFCKCTIPIRKTSWFPLATGTEYGILLFRISPPNSLLQDQFTLFDK
eukprot:m.436219 g.436219  ORF g.436219 m.436219 type:complete len:80 (-) comp17951_c0_seq1:34-273(-)